jgi:serine/threonine-protein kinase RsbW
MTSPPDRPADRSSSSPAGTGQQAMEGKTAAVGAAPRQGTDLPGLAPGTPSNRVFPGEARQLSLVRRWLASLLPDCPARDDMACVATELATNAIRHTASGRGGYFIVEITNLGSAVRVAVTDGGAANGPLLIHDPAGEHGRGLIVIAGLSVRDGVSGDPRSRTVWADVPWAGVRDADAGQRAGRAALLRLAVG